LKWVMTAPRSLLRLQPENQLHKIIRGAKVRTQTKVTSEADCAA
jgi:hypothetical protein